SGAATRGRPPATLPAVLPLRNLPVRSLVLLRLEFLDVLLGVGVELVAAAGAADVERLALVRHRHGADAAGDDALLLLLRLAQALTHLGGGDLVLLDELGAALRLALVGVDEADALGGGVHGQLLHLLGVRVGPLEAEVVVLQLPLEVALAALGVNDRQD